MSVGSGISVPDPTAPSARIVTPRAVLEPMRRTHSEELWVAVESSKQELGPWLAWAGDASPASVELYTREAELAWQASTSWSFAILLDGRAVGGVGLNGFKPVLAYAELGYWISSSLAGRGLMTEAAAAVVEWGFEVLGLHRIELRASPDNVGSVRVAEKIGFQREGIARSACRGIHGWHDVITFGLLRSDERLHP